MPTDELAEIERELIKELNPLPDCGREYFMRVWQKLVAERAARKRERWIPVTPSTMPEDLGYDPEFDDVLWPLQRVYAYPYQDIAYYAAGRFFECVQEGEEPTRFVPIPEHRVTHWRPLPAAPGEGETKA